MAAFLYSTPVMFQHCDPAGIVFYPRYFEMMNATVETFFGEAIGWPFRQMHAVDRVGVPLGRVTTDFHAASRLGDVLDWSLAVTRVGGASLDVTLSASCGEEARLTAEATLVLIDLDRMKALRWPDGPRAMFETYKEE